MSDDKETSPATASSGPEKPAEGPQGVFTCPRRHEDGTAQDGGVFVLSGSNRDTWNRSGELETCSYCGSLPAAFVLQKLREGVELIPTDKNYKGYLRVGPHGQAKFYFQHWSDAEQAELIELVNAKRVRFAEPGGFYVLPFFCVAASKGAAG